MLGVPIADEDIEHPTEQSLVLVWEHTSELEKLVESRRTSGCSHWTHMSLARDNLCGKFQLS